MKKLMVVLAVGVAGALVMAQEEAERVNPESERAIRQVVDMYYRGVIHTDRALLEGAWAVDQAHMKYVEPLPVGAGNLKVVPVSLALEWWTRNPAGTSSSKIHSVDIVNDEMAMVKFEFHYDRLIYLEYLTLFKIKGEWKLVNKTYSRRVRQDKPQAAEDGAVKPADEKEKDE